MELRPFVTATIMLFALPMLVARAGAQPVTAPSLLDVAPADSLASAAPSPARVGPTGLLRTDRLEHLSLAFTLGLGAGLITRQPGAAAATPIGLGFAKEIRDRHHGGFDPVDLLADAVGAGLAALATRALDR
jgi:hypothetical protein